MPLDQEIAIKARYGDLATVQWWVRRGEDLSDRCRVGWDDLTLLHCATKEAFEVDKYPYPLTRQIAYVFVAIRLREASAALAR